MDKKSLLHSYIELTKPRILTLVLITTILGYYLGGKGIIHWWTLFYLLLGSGAVCGGSSVLNHYLEREFDSKMQRTKHRPIPRGAISPYKAFCFGTILVLSGIILLYVKINILTSFLSLLTAFLYILVYTPMKRVSWLNTTIGAFPGAIPPLGGWAAATGTLNFDAGMLFLILFVWQHPHFYAIAWMCKEDYKRGGFKMLPCIDGDGQRTVNHVLAFSFLLIPISIIPVLTGLAGTVYLTGTLLAGFGLFYISQKFAKSRSFLDAKNLLKATVIYLPTLLVLIIADYRF